jgi:hypothetical protein
LLHLAFLLIVAGCLIAAWWQVHRAMQGNTLSYLYSVEWPAFAVVAGIGWWQMFHDTPEDIAARKEYHQKMRAASVAVVARTLPRSARAITVGSSDVDTRRLAEGSSRLTAIGGPGTESVPEASPPVESAALVRLDGDDLQTVLLEAEDAEGDPSDPLTAYNRYLASLALHGKAKTWRNPRGI